MIEANDIQNDDVDVVSNNTDTETKISVGSLEDISILAAEDKIEPTSPVEVASDLVKEFYIFENKKYDYNSDMRNKCLQREINTLFKLGLDNLKQGYNTTTSSSSTNKKIRADEAIRRARIALVLLAQESIYPNFKRAQLEEIVNGSLIGRDIRVKKKYLRIIEDYSTKDKINGTFNVENYCNQIPQKYMEQARQELQDG